MKFKILHYFFIMHLCNIKISAVLIRHKSKGRHYDIDGFISQLLASRKFDDLAEKLAEKAANKIMHIDASPAHNPRATDDNKVNNITEGEQEINQKQSNREYRNNFGKNQMNNEFTGKINPHAVLNETISLAENLQLKYKYLKKNALEKRVKSNQNQLSKNDTDEDTSKYNKTTGPADFIDRNIKTEVPISNQNATSKNQNDTKIESIDETKRPQDDTKRRNEDDDGKEDPNRNSELNESCHSGTDGETNDNSKNQTDNSLVKLRPGDELTISREAQNSRPAGKGVLKQETRQVKNGITEDKPLNLDEQNQKHLTRSEEKNIEEMEKIEGEPEKRGTGEINVGENVIARFRTREDSTEDSKVNSDYRPHVGVYRTRVSDDSGDNRGDDRPKEQSLEDQRSIKQSSEDQSSKEQSDEDSNSSKFKPVIRTEGDKLYTYVRAPEYMDYHEKLDKWRNQHPENPADFMK